MAPATLALMEPSDYIHAAYDVQARMPWRLPRTKDVELEARSLMQCLAEGFDSRQPGNLYGVLLAENAKGDRLVLSGVSGAETEPANIPPGERWEWVPPLPVGVQMALAETRILATLDQLKRELLSLKTIPAQATHQQVAQQYATQLQTLAVSHRHRKQQRARQRIQYADQLTGEALVTALRELDKESQQESAERRCLKQARDQALRPLAQEISQVEQHIQTLKLRYKTLSKQWQTQMQAAYLVEQSQTNPIVPVKNWADDLPDDSPLEALNLKELCYRAAAKLLYYAIAHQLKPLALAEFWWGAPQGNYVSGQFYDASAEECHFLKSLYDLGPLPEIAAPVTPLPILYQDEDLIVVDKPSGLLSVPGRRYHLQDSVLSRLRHQLPEYSFLQPVHRLDRDTSGILAIAASATAHRTLSKQFAQRQVRKTYEAILSRPIDKHAGTVELPLWGDPAQRPRQMVNFQKGKPSQTHFRVLAPGNSPRVELSPQTGRTHQLRVHAAHPQGLNSPIVGDILYDEAHEAQETERLHLHATAIEFAHPVQKEWLRFKSAVPF